MTRVQIVLAALGAVLLVVLFWLLLWSPKQEELDTVRADIDAAHQQQEQLTAERDELRSVRDNAPGLAAELAAAASVVPDDPALPAALRQLQTAADEAGVVLQTVSPARPTQVGEAEAGVSAISVSAQLSGSYFQLVDFLRRIEDPTITPRGLIWESVNLSRDEYPTLNVALSGTMFTRLPGPPTEEQPADDNDDAADGTEETDDADVEVEVEEDAA